MTEPKECRMILAAADVAGFVKICKQKTDLEVFKMLDVYYKLVGDIVGNAGGVVIKTLGDEVLVVFPEEKGNEAVEALRELVAGAKSIWNEFGVECVLRAKAHIGNLVFGPIGPDQRSDIIGNAVNQLFLMKYSGDLFLSEEFKKILK